MFAFVCMNMGYVDGGFDEWRSSECMKEIVMLISRWLWWSCGAEHCILYVYSVREIGCGKKYAGGWKMQVSCAVGKFRGIMVVNKGLWW